MDTQDKILEKYQKLFPGDLSFEDISGKLSEMEADPDIYQLRRTYCNEMVYFITRGYIEYGKNVDFSKDPLIALLDKNEKELAKDDYFFHMLANFYRGNQKTCLKAFDGLADKLHKECKEKNTLLDEGSLVDELVEPMKNAFPGFWEYAGKKLFDICQKDGTQEICNLMADIYERESDEAILDRLTSFVQQYPSITIAREYLACIYMNLKMYNNALAYLEGTSKSNLFAICPEEKEFMIAVCYGKLHKLREEEEHYRKVLEINAYRCYAANNLGYCLYKQKRYLEAKDAFEACLEKKIDLPYSANNYLRVLLALGRYKDAKAFINKSEYKLSKDLVRRAKAKPNTNQRLKKQDEIEEIIEEKDTTADSTALAVKGTQFSTEKLLEDELTMRIEAGMPVFGKNLKVYKRKGAYGRQYIIPIGRLDLLCEDDAGTLYIIELKKDSGYDDAYAQTAEYLDWFEKNWKEHKKIEGIICLNDPSQELLDKVHADKRMRVFEYQISYTER